MKRNKTYQLVIFSLLIALTYVATFIMIPLPTGDKIHLGNLMCILSALLLGGVKGGLIGSIGMGLNDLHFYLDSPSTIIKTLILKFLMGLICGALFNLFNKKEVKKKYNILILASIVFIFLIMFILTLLNYLNKGILVNGKIIEVHILIPISCILFSILLIIAIFFIKDKDMVVQYVLIAVSIATIFNIIAEFIFRIFLNVYIDGYAFETATILSLIKIPASLLTGIITTVTACTLYPLLKLALGNKLNS